MGTITRPCSFGMDDCIGCGKPLTNRNTYVFHNRRCMKLYHKKLDEAMKPANSKDKIPKP